MSSSAVDAELLAAAAGEIRSRCGEIPTTAVTLGSGQGGLVDHLAVDWSIPYRDLPGGRETTALGHAGRLSCGRLGGRPVLFLEGRTHLYEGAGPGDITRMVRLLGRLGIQRLVLTNAAGGLHPDYEVGDLVVLADCLDLTFIRSHPEKADAVGRPPGAPPLFDPGLAEIALATARRADIRAHTRAYVAVTGPNYETPAEWRAYRRLGGDVIGMSTALEARAATRLGIRVLGLSTVTNCCRPDAPEATDGAQVVAAAGRALRGIERILTEILAVP